MANWRMMTSYGVLSGLGILQPYLMATADDLASALQQRAVADFNDWLVRACCSPRVCFTATSLENCQIRIVPLDIARTCLAGQSPV